MPNFGYGCELEEARPDNRIYLFVEIQVTVKYNTQVLCKWSDVREVIEVLGNSSGMMWEGKEYDLCLVLI